MEAMLFFHIYFVNYEHCHDYCLILTVYLIIDAGFWRTFFFLTNKKQLVSQQFEGTESSPQKM